MSENMMEIAANKSIIGLIKLSRLRDGLSLPKLMRGEVRVV